MDIDDPLGELVAQLCRQDLHVARQYDRVGTLLAHQSGHLGERLLLVHRIDRNMEIRNAMPLDHAAQVIVVRNHAGNIAIEFAAVPAMQQIRQTMGLAARHQHDPLALLGVGDAPLHGKLTGNRCKGVTKSVQVEG